MLEHLDLATTAIVVVAMNEKPRGRSEADEQTFWAKLLTKVLQTYGHSFHYDFQCTPRKDPPRRAVTTQPTMVLQ